MISMIEIGKNASSAARQIANIPTEQKDRTLRKLANILLASSDKILAAT